MNHGPFVIHARAGPFVILAHAGPFGILTHAVANPVCSASGPTERYLLKNPEWKYDVIPEIWDGKNIADYIDPEIEEKLLALEREEDELINSGFYDNSELELVRTNERTPWARRECWPAPRPILGWPAPFLLIRWCVFACAQDEAGRERAELAEAVRSRKELHIQKARLEKKAGKNRPSLPRKANALSSGQELEARLTALGHDDETIQQVRSNSVSTRKRARSESRPRSASRGGDREDGAEGEGMDEDGEERVPASKRVRSSSRVPSRSVSGLRDEAQVVSVNKLIKKTQRRANRMARAGEGDRVILNAMPKHLFAGKRKSGTNDRR